VLLPKNKPIRDKQYRIWLSGLPCVLTGRPDVQVAHIGRLGMGIKNGDDKCLPLSCEKHAEQHAMGSEAKFWAKYGKTMREVEELCNALWFRQHDTDAALMLIAKFKRGVTHG